MARTPYISIDIETTGLDPDTCQIIEIGAVIEDWVTPIEDLKRFHCYVVYDRYVGEPYALSMHATIFRRIAERNRDINKDFCFCQPEDVVIEFEDWLVDHGFDLKRAFTPAGKNFSGFDRQFLKRLPGFDRIKMRHRAVDPGNLFWNPDTDTELPSSEACLKRAKIEGVVAHTALADALDVIREVRYWYDSRPAWTDKDLGNAFLKSLVSAKPE